MERSTEARAGEAFRRLLAEASTDERARVDALIAFSQRTVWVATWLPVSDAWRTLEHDDGSVALPVFSDEWELDRAAAELAWTQGSAPVGRKEVGARETMKRVLDEQYAFLLIDLASDHCIEASRAEVEPLARAGSSSDSQGPYAAVGRITSTMMEAVRSSIPSSSPGTLGAVSSSEGRFSDPPRAAAFGSTAPSAPHSFAPKNPSYTPGALTLDAFPGLTSAASAAAAASSSAATHVEPSARTDTGAKLSPVEHDQPDALLDAVSEALKRFPEVEWASYCVVALDGEAPRPMIGVRVDAGFRTRVANIAAAIAGVADAHGHDIDTLLLDEPGLMRDARQDGVPFHPWRRRKTGSFNAI